MALADLRYTPGLLTRPAPRGLAVETTLDHFAIVTYRVDPAALARHLHPRFEPTCIDEDGTGRSALVSVVTFLDRDFRFVAAPWFTRRFGQTNYRAYITDRESGDQAAWFFGTCLDSVSVAIPRYLWRLPWHRARLTFDCAFDPQAGRYARFRVETASGWSPGHLVLDDSGHPPETLAGFASLDAGLVVLTHPLRGYFYRTDGALGSYAIWHDRAAPSVGHLREARYPLLQSLGLVETGDLRPVHSVLLQPAIDFTIYLPPSLVGT